MMTTINKNYMKEKNETKSEGWTYREKKWISNLEIIVVLNHDENYKRKGESEGVKFLY